MMTCNCQAHDGFGMTMPCEFHGKWLESATKPLESEVRRLDLQNGEAKRLLGEALRWIGVDPSYQESIQMGSITAEIKEFLGLTEKRKCEHTWTETQCSTCGDPKPDYKRKDDKSGGDVARCGKCGKFYVDHADDDCHG